MDLIIRIEKVDKFFYLGRPEEVRALNQIDLEIFQNRITLIRGPSGSGKTTLLHILFCSEKVLPAPPFQVHYLWH